MFRKGTMQFFFSPYACINLSLSFHMATKLGCASVSFCCFSSAALFSPIRPSAVLHPHRNFAHPKVNMNYAAPRRPASPSWRGRYHTVLSPLVPAGSSLRHLEQQSSRAPRSLRHLCQPYFKTLSSGRVAEEAPYTVVNSFFVGKCRGEHRA